MRHLFKPPVTRPDDFEAFWHSTRLQLESLDPDIQRTPAPEMKSGNLREETVSFVSLGGVRISARFVHWNDGKPRPLIIYSHGYGDTCRPRHDWAKRGANVFGIDVRGFGLSAGALTQRSHWGYVLTGIETPETSVLRLAVCDYMQAARVALRLCGQQVSRTVFHGVSFAGGLALMAESILQQADLLAVGVPTFGWAEGRNLFVKQGSGAEINTFLQHRPGHTEDVMLVLRYFDAVNFADSIECPTLVGLGLHDEVVPAKTVYGIANHLAGPHQVMEFPVSHSDHPDEQQWSRFEETWIGLALMGVPASFGQDSG